MATSAADASRQLLTQHIPNKRSELRKSSQNLPPLADHVQQSYAAAASPQDANRVFNEAKGFVIQALASVAYQVNDLSVAMLQTLDVQAVRLEKLAAEVQTPVRRFAMQEEQAGRSTIARLTTPASCPEGKPYEKRAVPTKPTPVKPGRRLINFDELDKVGHGVFVAGGGRTMSVHSARPQAPRGPAPAPAPSPADRRDSTASGAYGSVVGMGNEPMYAEIPRVPESIYGGVGESIYGTTAVPVAAPAAPMAPVAPTAPSAPAAPMASAPAAPSAPAPPPPLVAAPPPPPAAPAPPGQATDEPTDYGFPVDQASAIEDENPYGTAIPIGGDNVYSTIDIPGPPSDPPPDDGLYGTVTNIGSGDAGPVHVDGSQARAVYAYDATRDDELTFAEGDVITIVHRNDDGWFEGVLNGKRGLFPGNYVEEMEDTEA